MNIENNISTMDWKFASKNHDDDFHTDIVFLRVSTSSMKNYCGCSYDNTVLYYKGFSGEFYYPHQEVKKVCNFLIDKLISAPQWGESMNDLIIDKSRELTKVWAKQTALKSFANFSTSQIIRLYNKQLLAQKRLYEIAWVPEILQDDIYGITNYFQQYLEAKKVKSCDFDKVIRVLSSNHHMSVYKEEISAILLLTKEILESPYLYSLFKEPLRYIRLLLPAELKRKINILVNKYGFLGYHGYDSRRPYEFADYISRLYEYVNNPELYNDAIASLQPYEDEQGTREYYIHQFKIDPLHQKIFSIYGEFAATKAIRRLAQLQNFYYLDMLIEEIALRFNMPEKWIRFMKPEEIIGLLRNTLNIPADFEERTKEMIFISSNYSEAILTGPKVAPFIDLFKKENIDKESICLTGSCACGGCAFGRAFLAKRGSDALKIQSDEPRILVSVEADPDLFPLVRQMAAVVTDQGGITCHVAIIAREFNIPCIVGAQKATEFISEGDYLEVDANRGTVKILKKGT